VRFVAAHRAEFGVATLCGAINLPVSTFYDRSSRPPSARAQADSELAERIEKIWTDSGRTYGSPRVHAQLARDGVYVGRKRVERIMADTAGEAPTCAAAGKPRPAVTAHMPALVCLIWSIATSPPTRRTGCGWPI
jgi:transposase InsO family protein